MKTAVACVDTIIIKCPHCGEYLPNPTNGSYTWMPEDVGAQGDSPLWCIPCQRESKLPALAKRMMA